MTARTLILSVSTDYRHDGVSRIWDECRNAYVAERGAILEFATPYDAAQRITDIELAAWLEGAPR